MRGSRMIVKALGLFEKIILKLQKGIEQALTEADEKRDEMGTLVREIDEITIQVTRANKAIENIQKITGE